MASEQELCAAIAARAAVKFFYAGSRPSIRIVEPFIVGFGSAGNLELSGWLLSGGSGTGWRNFLLSDMSSLSIIRHRRSTVRRDYNPNDPSFDRIICRV